MTTWQAFLLGIVQGITEFLPISSSGHLALGQHFLGLETSQKHILFNLTCHLGTLCAIFAYFFPTIKESVRNANSRLWHVLLGTLPLFPLVLILKPLKGLLDHPQFLGPCFLFSASLLFIGLHWHSIFNKKGMNKKWHDSLTIGLFQAIAILPGISRSGATISAAYLLGWQKKEAIQFSFLLAIPAILGATILEGWQVWQIPTANSSFNPRTFLIGFVSSFFVGLFSLKILLHLVIEDKWVYFAWYCLFLGIFTTLYFNLFF